MLTPSHQRVVGSLWKGYVCFFCDFWTSQLCSDWLILESLRSLWGAAPDCESLWLMGRVQDLSWMWSWMSELWYHQSEWVEVTHFSTRLPGWSWVVTPRYVQSSCDLGFCGMINVQLGCWSHPVVLLCPSLCSTQYWGQEATFLL